MWNKSTVQSGNYSSVLLKPTQRVYFRPLFMDETLGVKIIEGDIEKLLSDLYSFDLDFIITENISTSLINKNVGTDSYHHSKIFLRVREKIQKRNEKLSLKTLMSVRILNIQLIMNLQKEVDRFFFKNGTLPSVVGESDDVNIIAAATEINHCFSILPDSVIKNAVNEDRLRVLGEFKSTEAHVSALHLKSVSKG